MAQERFKNTGTETIFGDALKVRYPKLPDGDGFEPEAVSQDSDRSDLQRPGHCSRLDSGSSAPAEGERVHRDGPLSPRRC
jgi:hypothetical protein